ncbi:hypothetical protein [Orenia marismortui]|uniref:hypothetical protein n=1 Tax=Orenia marismortui TaxID=46469 RepID=UPI000370147C|nr:hypothetical protein [Orenia marismortui]
MGKLIIILAILLTTLLLLNMPLQAKELKIIIDNQIEQKQIILKEGRSIEGYGGFSLNQYSLTEINNYIKDKKLEELELGYGIFLGCKKWLSEDLAVGGEIECIIAKSDNANNLAKASAIGYLGTISYRFNQCLSSQISGGLYSANLRLKGIDDISESNSAYGFKVGLGLEAPIDLNIISLKARIAYRRLKVGLENPRLKNMDFSGIETGVILDIKF